MKKVLIIGSGFSGLSAACFMAKDGWDVTVVEKHPIPGGRARNLKAQGFTFDMGPSWYWMPDIFERFFNTFGYKVSDFYSLQRLDPSYRVYWKNEETDIPADYEQLRAFFERKEKGGAKKLDVFIKEAGYKYDTGIGKLVFKPGRSFTEFLDGDLFRGMLRLDVFTSIKKHIRKYFRDPRLIQLLEFPVLFLGAMPADIPALYSLMNYADIKLGTWYPQGGMYQVVDAMHRIGLSLGVSYKFDHEVTSIDIDQNAVRYVKGISTEGKFSLETDVVIGAADYHFIEQALPPSSRSYSEQYWEKRTMAPSCLIYFVGINKKLRDIRHHNLFFDTDFENHGKDIYEKPTWPEDPLFYVCCPSVTDTTVAPYGSENLFFLIPVAAGLTEDEALRELYFQKILKRFEARIGESITDFIVYKKTYAHSDFVDDYNAFRGNAYGLANTLMQTAFMKPALKSRRVKNLFYAGQLTVPGPGVPPAIVSGEVVAKEIFKEYNTKS